MTSTLVLFAHPLPSKSVTTRALLAVLEAQPDVAVRSLYDLYPDYDIDVQAEQDAVLEADTLVMVTPVNWYSVPALLKHWLDVVMTHGWAHGKGGDKLKGKRLWWIASAGAAEAAYSASGSHYRPFNDFVAPLEHTARYCSMRWLPPFVVYAGSHATDAQRATTRNELHAKCVDYLAGREHS